MQTLSDQAKVNKTI